MRFNDAIKVIHKKRLLKKSDIANEIGDSFSVVNRRENGAINSKLCVVKLIKNLCIVYALPFGVEDCVFENDKLKWSNNDANY